MYADIQYRERGEEENGGGVRGRGRTNRKGRGGGDCGRGKGGRAREGLGREW